MKNQTLKERFLAIKRALFEKKYEFLNREQKRAVFTVNGPLLVLAGAGSGKTTVLVNRVAAMIQYGNAYMTDETPADLSEETVASLEGMCSLPAEAIDGILDGFKSEPCMPWAILTFTFTNKAANEMKERLATVLGEQTAREIWAGTFHSICVRILRRDGHLIGYAPGFTIYDTDDSKRQIRDCMKTLNIDEKIMQPKAVMNMISKAKEKLMSPEAFEAEAGSDYKLQIISKIYTEYQKNLEENNALDFDDIIMKTVVLLEKEQEVREYYQRRFKYVCVDEYQDTNHAQFRLIGLLSGYYRNIMVVGDDDQSIYAFRGATIENILNFDKVFPDATVIKLEQNYRSTGNILAAANAVIQNNRGRHAKVLWTKQGDGEKITLRKLDNQNEEARFIVDQIMRLTYDKRELKDIAVLYRVNAQAQALEAAFARSGLSYKVLGGTRFYDRKEIKDIMAYLCLVNNTNDNLRLKRIVNVPKRSIGNATIDAVEQIASYEGISMFAVMENASQYTALAKSAVKLKTFTDLIHKFIHIKEENSLPVLFQQVIELSGYRAMLEAGGEAERDRLENVEELISSAVEYDMENEEASLSGFLEDVALISDTDQYDQEGNAVVLMTIHSAKGLEFPVVFLPGLEDGVFPGFRSQGSTAEMEEERRLAYVAITRAKENLYITHTKSRLLYGSTSYNPLSCFIKEIPDQYLDQEREPEREKPSTIGFKEMTRIAETVYKPKAAVRLSSGDRVVHMAFGEGTVLSVKDMGGDMLYEVAFDTAGTKKMMGSYAKLKKV
ncbi:MAG: UvrD-helicase domain-containing protein [Clostridiales bacterium]|nr:UvrD-helicase domain-containing protein [Clostridiales bacterium]